MSLPSNSQRQSGGGARSATRDAVNGEISREGKELIARLLIALKADNDEQIAALDHACQRESRACGDAARLLAALFNRPEDCYVASFCERGNEGISLIGRAHGQFQLFTLENLIGMRTERVNPAQFASITIEGFNGYASDAYVAAMQQAFGHVPTLSKLGVLGVGGWARWTRESAPAELELAVH